MIRPGMGWAGCGFLAPTPSVSLLNGHSTEYEFVGHVVGVRPL